MIKGAQIGIAKPLSEYRNDAWKCVKCRLCGMTNPEELNNYRFSDNCPSGSRFKFEAYFATGRFEIIRALTCNPPELKVTDKLIHIAYTCTECGNCQVTCNQMKSLEPTNAIISLREWLVENGHGPLKEHLPLIKSIQNYDNPWMHPRAQRDKWAKKSGIKLKDVNKEKAEVLFWVGCTGSYDPTFKPVAEATARILSSLGIDVGILGKTEKCCGSTVYRVGARKDFDKVRMVTKDQLNATEAKTIVTSCSGCYSTFKHMYEGDLKAEVLHITQFLEKILEEGKIEYKNEIPKKVTYHDPCHIGRYSGIFDAPRKILKSIPGIGFVEMERIKDWSLCCGAGAGVKTAFPDIATWTASRRIEEAQYTGASTIVSTCPFCEQNLSNGISSLKLDMEVSDLITLVDSSIGK